MHRDSPDAVGRRPDHVGGAALAIVATLLMVVAIAYAGPRMDVGTGSVVGTALVCGGAALAGVMRVLSATTASVGQWLRRYAAGVLLLTPAALQLVQPFLAEGWDFDTCGTLVDRHHYAGATFVDFEAGCDLAARKQLLLVIVWAGAGCVAAGAYGLRQRFVRLKCM